MVDVGRIGRQVLEMLITVGASVGVDQMIRGGLDEKWKFFLQKVEQQTQYRVIARQYIAHTVDDPYRTALQKKYEDALRAEQIWYANRIEGVYALVYAAFENERLGNETERGDMRKREFEDLGRAALNPDPAKFDAMLEFYEERQFHTYLMVAQKIGIDVWDFLTRQLGVTVDAVGGEGAKERLQAYIRDPQQWRRGFVLHRERVRTQAQQKITAMQEAYMWSVVEADARPPDKTIYYVVGIVLALTIISCVIGLSL